jgi:hypothetical protein
MNCIRAILILCLAATAAAAEIPTVAPRLIDIEGPLADRHAEISGMAWYEDTLIIMPQFPDRFAEGPNLGFFGIPKSHIRGLIEGLAEGPLDPRLFTCHAPGLAGIVRGFDGLEAIGMIGNRSFFTVEAEDDTSMAGYLVSGIANTDNGEHVALDLSRVTPIPLGVNIPNIAEESIIMDGDRVITLSEANGKNVNPLPMAKVFDLEANFVGQLPMPQIEYRVTDATDLDENDRFWVINYYYPPEGRKIKPAPDPELARFGDPASFDPLDCIERLVELQLVRDRCGDFIERTETPPINLELLPDRECRNWEALVRLDDLGFLIMTDKFPTTLLAFVPWDFKE